MRGKLRMISAGPTCQHIVTCSQTNSSLALRSPIFPKHAPSVLHRPGSWASKLFHSPSLSRGIAPVACSPRCWNCKSWKTSSASLALRSRNGMASPTRPAWYSFAPAFQIAPLSARRAWRTRELPRDAGSCSRGAEEREMARVKTSNVFLKVSEWEVESVDRARANRASYADTRTSLASAATMASFYQGGGLDTNVE